MREFRLLNYFTEYAYEGDYSRGMDNAICFSQAFNEVTYGCSLFYTIHLYKGIDQAVKYQKSNVCLFNRQEIKNHIKQLNSIYPVEVKVLSADDKYIVKLGIKGAPALFHKLALTWTRYLYEFPYCMLIRDAYNLKKEKCFRFESIFNLFNVTLSSYCDGPRQVHQVINNKIYYRISKKQLKKSVDSVPRLEYLCTPKQNKSITILREYDGFSNLDLEYWDLYFNERKKVYLEVFKLTKKR